MTAVGKLLAFVNLFVAIALVTWSTSAYVNRSDWVDGEDANKAPVPGQISKMDAEIKKLTKSISDSQASYGDRKTKLETAEKDLDYRRAQFKKRLDTAEGDLDPKGSFHEQVPQDSTKPGGAAFTDLEAPGKVIVTPDGKPLRGLKSLRIDYDRETKEAVRFMNGRKLTPEEQTLLAKIPSLTATEFAELIEPPKDKNLDILGFYTMRDLHSMLTDRVKTTNVAVEQQRVIMTNLRDESRFLGDNRVNWIVQLQILERRQRQLEKRLAELGAAPTAAP